MWSSVIIEKCSAKSIELKNLKNFLSQKVFDKPYNWVCPPLFLMNYCSMHLIQSIGKVSKLPTYSKKSRNGAKKKPAVSKKNRCQSLVHPNKSCVAQFALFINYLTKSLMSTPPLPQNRRHISSYT